MKKSWLAIGFGGAFFVLAVGAFFLPPGYLQALSLSVASALLALSLGLFIVNIYLSHTERVPVVRALLLLVNRAIARFHNKYVGILLEEWGRKELEEIMLPYYKADGDIKVLNPNFKKAVHTKMRQNANEVDLLIDDLEESISELTNLVGWDLDNRLLDQCLRGKNAIREYKAARLGDSDDCDDFVEALLDVDAYTQAVRGILREIAGFDENDT